MLRKLLLLIFALTIPGFGQLPLGTITNVKSVPCSSGFAAGSVCQSMTVHACPNTNDLSVTIGVLNGQPGKPAIILFSGGSGTQATGGQFASYYHSAGFTVVDTAWVGQGWEWTGQTPDILAGACRVATLRSYVHNNYGSDGLCEQGTSAGSGAIAYDLAHYGGSNQIDAVELLSGPVFSRIDLGCEVPNVSPARVLPTDGQSYTAIVDYVYPNTQLVSTETGQTCNPPGSTTPAEDNDWLAQSILNGNQITDYPQTSVSGWECDNNLNNSEGQGWLFFQAVTSPYSLTRISGCAGSEGVGAGKTPQGLEGATAIEQDMTNKCSKNSRP